jgi:hypothetical protein
MSDEITPLGDRVRLVELVDRVLDRGVVLRGDVTISVAGVDLVYLELRLLLAGVEALSQRALPPLRDASHGADSDTTGAGLDVE